MKIVWTDPAIDDLQSIRDYIARDSELYADSFVSTLLTAVERLESFPKIGRVTPEAGNPEIRGLLLGSYRIIYRIRQEMIQILTVIHGSRELSQLPTKPWET
jgi:addiction module RelE/StbE family toxin